MLKLKMNNSVSLVTNSWPKSSPAALKKSLSLRAALGTGSCGCDRDVVSLRRSGSLSFPLTKPPVRGFHQLCLITFYSMLGREMRESTENATCILYNIYNAYGHIHFYIPFTGKAMIFQQPENRQSPGRQSCDWSTHHLASWKLGGVHKNLPNQIPKFTHHCIRWEKYETSFKKH